MARAAQSDIAAMRTNLQREKELEIVTIKKELLSEKENQLQNFRDELSRAHDESCRRMMEEVNSIREESNQTITNLENQLQEMKQLLTEKENQIRELQLHQRSAQQSTKFSFQQQFDSIGPELHKLQDIINTYEMEKEKSQTRLYHILSRIQPVPFELNLQELINHLDSCVDSSSNTISHLKSKLELQESKFAQLNGEINAKNEEITKLRHDHQVQIQTLTAQLDYERKKAIQAELNQLQNNQSNPLSRSNYESVPCSGFPSIKNQLSSSFRPESTNNAILQYKDQLKKAYDRAITKLKSEYNKLETQLRETSKRNQENKIAEIQQKYQERLQKEIENVKKEMMESNSRLKDVITNYEVNVNIILLFFFIFFYFFSVLCIDWNLHVKFCFSLSFFF